MAEDGTYGGFRPLRESQEPPLHPHHRELNGDEGDGAGRDRVAAQSTRRARPAGSSWPRRAWAVRPSVRGQ